MDKSRLDILFELPQNDLEGIDSILARGHCCI